MKLSKMSVFVTFLFIAIISIQSIGTEENNSDCVEFKLKAAGSNIFHSFMNFKENVKTFFRFNLRRIEKGRRKLKNALQTFLDTAFKDDDVSSTTPYSIKSLSNSNEEPITMFEELVSKHGYRLETHNVITTDGYVLTTYRIFPVSFDLTDTKTEAVLLHHGFLGSSDDWIILGSEKALPYLLVNANYDVWLTNARGNKYSRAHTGTTTGDDGFWNFSWHEMGQYDLASVIDHIIDTNDKIVNLHFIGHSMGGTALLVLLSLYPRYNNVLKSAILLAPLAYMHDVKGPIKILAEFYNKNSYDSLNYSGFHEFVPLDCLPQKFINKFCHEDTELCKNPLLLFANGGQKLPNINTKANILSHVPAGGSKKTFLHYIQLVKSGQFQMYDLGPTKNLEKYGQESPPIYRLNDITLPVVIFSSVDDWLATFKDIKSLIPNLSNLVMHHKIKRAYFSHTDFVWADDADILVYNIILDVLTQN